MKEELTFFWFRRDLRLKDNAGLYYALKNEKKVAPLFIFDRAILDELPEDDKRVQFIYQEIQRLRDECRELGSDLLVLYGRVEEEWDKLLDRYTIKSVYTNTDYEPYAKTRDASIEQKLQTKGGSFHAYKDHVIFHQDEVRKSDGDPYTVFTPYKKTWIAKLKEQGQAKDSFYIKSYPTLDHTDSLIQDKFDAMPSLQDMGFEEQSFEFPKRTVKAKKIKQYDETRDYPALDGTSKLGVHLRFGTISIRILAQHALALNETFLSELIWRDFYSGILDAFPHVVEESFKRKYDKIQWVNNQADFDAWCQGKTGYPMVDAGMRELNETGYMHNRVRMVTASFLCKHLMIDWRWGESYFAIKLLDFDLASNNGGWQWSAGSGTDAAPYFRIFNPASQLDKFDKNLEYVKKWIPEWGTADYPEPIVDHKEARKRCLETYKAALS